MAENRARRRPLAGACDRSHERYALAVSERLGLFDRTLATNGDINLSAHNKRTSLAAEFGEKGFDYAGNSRDDIFPQKSNCHPDLGQIASSSIITISPRTDSIQCAADHLSLIWTERWSPSRVGRQVTNRRIVTRVNGHYKLETL